jgi:2-methylisocitrate lyase-like PEP mutase family enzyme
VRYLLSRSSSGATASGRYRIKGMSDAPSDRPSPQTAAIAAFRKLHESGCFVLPNPWDEGTAVYLQHLGFQALATTSAGFAFTQGLPDDDRAIPLTAMLAHIRQVVAATPLPVNADFQSGYAHDPEGVAANVTLCIKTGVAGLSIEDATGDSAAPLYEQGLAVERIRAARAAVDASGLPVVLTARCEAALVGHPEAARVAVERLVAYAEVGADCLYAPGLREPEEIAAIVKAVAPKPVNVVVSAPSSALSVSRLTELGVRRISVGSALARVAWGAFLRTAKSIATTGSFDALADAASFAELNTLFRERG